MAYVQALAPAGRHAARRARRAPFARAYKTTLGPRGRGLGDTAPVAWPAQVEQWRDLVTQKAGDLPIEFLMAWINKESAGNPCSYTSYGESGIFQLMPGQNMQAGNVTQAQLRVNCSGSSQTQTRPLTDAERDIQVQSGIDYINNYARPTAKQFLAAAGCDWPEDGADGSFWTMVKMVFNLPGVIPGFLAAATAQLGHPPTSWAEMRSTINGYAAPLNNAEAVGPYGAGGGSMLNIVTGNPTVTLALVGGLALLAYLLSERGHLKLPW